MSVEISPAQVKELRERTGVGIAKCKEALEKCSGNMDEAIDFLRKSGMATAVKKSSREAKEGKIVFAEGKNGFAIVEINCETDFVAGNERFIQFATAVAEQIADSTVKTVEELLTQKSKLDPSLTVDELRGTIVQAIGENIQIKRFKLIPKAADSSVGLYSHMGGKLVTMVEIKGASGFSDLAKEIAMHAAAASPEYLSPEQVPGATIEHEKEIARTQVVGKPANIIEKIVDGKIKAFFDQICLIKQKYIRDDKVSVEEYVTTKGKAAGKTLTIVSFLRWSVGE